MEIRVDGHATQTWLEQIFRDQLPFATSLAVNRTATVVRDAIRAHLQDAFTIRRPWVVQGIQVTHISDKHDNPISATVSIDPQRAFLAKFEAGGTKSGSLEIPIAIPSAALRPSFTDIPPLALYPKNLRLLARHDVTGTLAATRRITKRGVVQIQGKQRTFVLDQTMFGVSVAGVYQRVGPGPHDIRLLWSYKQRIPIPARLQFSATALAAVEANWGKLYEAAFQQAVRTAR